MKIMETNVSYTIAGTFILILFTFTVYAVIWLSSGFGRKEYEHYTVYMDEPVSGLSQDGPVEFNGVKVGTVEQIRINHLNPQLVELTLSVEQGTPITMGTRAKFSMKALTGIAYVLLEDKGKDLKPLTKLADQRYPIIPTIPSILVHLDTILNKINESFSKLSISVESLLDKKNLRMITNILQSGNASLQSLEVKTLPRTNDAVESINTAAQHLDSMISEIRENPAVIIRGKAPATKLGPGEK
jgi:phospholipid/cholesterol/gamma-HCH transport system substrate-binding protein